ncbi:glycosyltransferase [Streptomyces sp. NPDC001536]|uniref:glycosyltransferase n=1 Tax=Streptomyces sp. NPDC001536 TaxID=3364583 RepID=UPI0036C2939D
MSSVNRSKLEFGRGFASASIVLPTFNEVAAVETALERLALHFQTRRMDYEIIVVDDGSTDGTHLLPWSEYSKRHNAIYLRLPSNRGKGAAVRAGLQLSQKDLVFFTDIDMPVDLSSFDNCVNQLLKGGTEFVMGNRRLRGSRTLGESFVCRRVVSRIFNVGARVMAVPGCTDTQCCLKGFTASSLERILPWLTLDSYAFDVEIILIARRLGVKCSEIPVLWFDLRSHVSHLRVCRVLVLMLWDVARMRFRLWRTRNTGKTLDLPAV